MTLHYVDEVHFWPADTVLPAISAHPSVEACTNATPDGTWVRLP